MERKTVVTVKNIEQHNIDITEPFMKANEDYNQALLEFAEAEKKVVEARFRYHEAYKKFNEDCREHRDMLKTYISTTFPE